MIGCLRTRVCKQPIIALYFEFETVLKFYNIEASCCFSSSYHSTISRGGLWRRLTKQSVDAKHKINYYQITVCLLQDVGGGVKWQ